MIEQEKQYYTFQQLKEKFNWPIKRSIGINEQIRYANSHGLEVSTFKKSNINYFIILNDYTNTFSKEEICIKYQWDISKCPDLLKYAENRGVYLKQLNFSKRPIYYTVIQDNIYWTEWKRYLNSNAEVCKEGYVRNIKTKLLVGTTKTSLGYLQYKDCVLNKCYMVHRMILETFNPIKNMESLLVDHIDGNRSNNNLSNLRWVSHQENMDFKTENWLNLEKILGQIIQKIGYEQTAIQLNNIFEKI